MKQLLEKISSIFNSRLFVVLVVYAVMFSILVVKILSVQVKANDPEQQLEEAKIYKLRDIKSTRGNIYDANGKLLAYNVMSYSVVMEGSGLLVTNAEKNSMIYRLIKILEKFDTDIEVSFGIELNEEGELVFNVEDTALLRFKKNAYGLTSVSKLTDEQIAATADEVFEFLCKGNSAAAMFQIDDSYSLEDKVKIAAIRYAIFSNPAATQFTVASNITEELAVAIKENGADLPGVEVKQVTSRVYNDSMFFAHIVGYTGAANTEEIENMNNEIIAANGLEGDDITDVSGVSLLYNASDVIGKTGIEKSMEKVLAGVKGTSVLTVNSAGKILSQTANTDSLAGDDVYLTIDGDLQKACYYILERNIAGILLSKLTPNMDYGQKGTDAKKIKIPIYEVYYALIDNGIINVSHFSADDATDLERNIELAYQGYKNNLLMKLNSILNVNSTVTNAETTEELRDYLNLIYNKATSSGLLNTSLVDTTDSTYKAYKNNQISMSEFFRYALSKNWINTSSFSNANDYYSITELYELFLDKLMTAVVNDSNFKEKIYHTLIFDRYISGRDICLLLYDQGVLKYSKTTYSRLLNGSLSAYDFIYNKIYSLEITPGQLGLTPCSGSVVVTDVRTGQVKALVTYPSYDNNKLANKIDYDYYSSLLNMNSYPLINRPAMQTTTTGSTFKPLTSLIGMGEGVISSYTKITDKGLFESVVPSPRCWIYPYSHGAINVTDAIMHSCNYFFFEVGYRLMNNNNGTYSDSTGIKTIQEYAKLFGLGQKTGIEISEATPVISNVDAVRTSIGYGHSFAPVQISRYITAVANKGTVFNYTLVDSIKTNTGALVEKNEPSVLNNLSAMYNDTQWDAVRYGMWKVVNTNVDGFDTIYKSLGVQVAGKTGTAQVSTTIPSHALFASFAPYTNPEISVTVVIPNGFQSANAAVLAREVYGYYFNGENREALLSGDVTASTATNINVSD